MTLTGLDDAQSSAAHETVKVFFVRYGLKRRSGTGSVSPPAVTAHGGVSTGTAEEPGSRTACIESASRSAPSTITGMSPAKKAPPFAALTPPWKSVTRSAPFAGKRISRPFFDGSRL